MVKENKHMKRVLLKLSGEALAGEQKRGFDEATVTEVAKQIKTIVDEGLQVGIVIGGGNFWRGRTSGAMDRSKADQIGMLGNNSILIASAPPERSGSASGMLATARLIGR